MEIEGVVLLGMLDHRINIEVFDLVRKQFAQAGAATLMHQVYLHHAFCPL